MYKTTIIKCDIDGNYTNTETYYYNDKESAYNKANEYHNDNIYTLFTNVEELQH